MDTIESALQDIAVGKIVIVLDDDDRENEGDLVMAADKVSPETINFMSKYGRGLICVPISKQRAIDLNLNLMATSSKNSSQAAFTVSVDSIYGGSGISAKDRSRTIKAITDNKTLPEELARPGHVFPLIANEGGVNTRRGHTEASVALAKLAGCSEAAVLCEVLDDDGETAKLEFLKKLAKIFRLKIITVDNLVKYIESKDRQSSSPALSLSIK